MYGVVHLRRTFLNYRRSRTLEHALSHHQKKYDHIQPIFNELGWLPVNSIVKLEDATMMFKCMNGLVPKYLSDKFICRSDFDSRNTRNKSKLNIPLCRSATGQRGFVYRATTIWNNLPDDMRNIQDLNV